MCHAEISLDVDADRDGVVEKNNPNKVRPVTFQLESSVFALTKRNQRVLPLSHHFKAHLPYISCFLLIILPSGQQLCVQAWTGRSHSAGVALLSSDRLFGVN